MAITVVEDTMVTTTSTTTTYAQVQLINSNGINTETAFPTCIYPDIDGAYSVKLTIYDLCTWSTDTVAVTAQCAGAPTVVASASEAIGYNGTYVTQALNYTADYPKYDVMLSRDHPRRVKLDASASQGFSTSKLTYYWAWAAPDPRAGTLNAQDDIDQPYGSMAAITLGKNDTYNLELTVHDGCSFKKLPITLFADCMHEPLDIQGDNRLTVRGGQVGGSLLQTFKLTEMSQAECAYLNQWAFVNYTAEPAAGASVRPVLSFIFALLALRLLM